MKLRSTREAIHDALAWGHMQMGGNGLQEYLVYLTKIEKSIVDRQPCVDFLEAAYICASINMLPRHVGGWLKYAYGPDDNPLLQDILASKLRFDLFPMTTAKKHNKLLALSSASVEDYRLRVRRNRDLPIVFYATKMGVDPDNWARDRWSEKRDCCHSAILNWDREGVGQVSRMVKSLRGETDEGENPTAILEEMLAK